MRQITDITRGYDSETEREDDIKRLREEGRNYFVRYRDTQAPIALMYGKRKPTTQPASNPKWNPRPGDPGFDPMH